MKYVVNKVLEIIKNCSPKKESETMIRVDGFEDIRFYEGLARKIEENYSNSELKVKVKLAKKKFDYFKKQNDLKGNISSYLQSLEQRKFIAEEESITRYRNLDSNILILMGTELEDDVGGLLNCFYITSESILKDLKNCYRNLFPYLSHFSENEKEFIDKLYKDLFSLVPADICKLSSVTDKWESSAEISTFDDFEKIFFNSLEEWGLPKRCNNLPTYRELSRKSNVLELQYKFISRALFKSMTKTKYADYQKKLNEYKENDGEYGPKWEGWAKQELKSYDEFSNSLMEFIRGENVEANKIKFIKTDFDIVAKILDIKLTKDKKTKNSDIKLKGEPLQVFIKALLYTLSECNNKNVSKIVFKINQAEIVSMYPPKDEADDYLQSDLDFSEENFQLEKSWKHICCQLNGVIPFINQKKWSVNGNDGISISLDSENDFSPLNADKLISNGKLKSASTNKTISKIDFSTECYNENVIVEDLGLHFSWQFSESNPWIHNFSDLYDLDLSSSLSYIPVSCLGKDMLPLIYTQSEEEFFDLYAEIGVRFDFNLIDFIQKKKCTSQNEILAMFETMGQSFVQLVDVIKKEGFFVSLLNGNNSEIFKLIDNYIKTGHLITQKSIPENQSWIIDAFIHAFNIENDTKVLTREEDSNCCIVPPWHPATLQKLVEKYNFFLRGCVEWWENNQQNAHSSKNVIDREIEKIEQMCLIQNSVDLFPSSEQKYFGLTSAYGAFSVYAQGDLACNNRLNDIIRKEAIYDDDFDTKEISQLNDNAKMIYSIINEYTKVFQKGSTLSLIFVNPSDLQPIVASIYKYIESVKIQNDDYSINIILKILVKPENKGGRNYLAFWMDEFFSQDANVNIKCYLNEWKTQDDLEENLNANNDLVFVMDLLSVNNFTFIPEKNHCLSPKNNCVYPIVYRPSPISTTSIRRKIELSQPQFSAAYTHTQVVRYKNNSEEIQKNNYIAVKEVTYKKETQSVIHSLHSIAYWVVCIDSGLDGALLRLDSENKDEFSVIGFSTGKGLYGQYNLTITARSFILKSIKNRLSKKLYQLFKWEEELVEQVSDICIREAGQLDGISLFSAINPRGTNIHEFMAYVLTSLREKQKNSHSALKIMIHLDSYKHWFSSSSDDDSESRPDFLLLELSENKERILNLKATIIECKIALESYSTVHKDKAVNQVKHGIKVLSSIFNPDSKSITQRYWFAQLYRALTFAQVTFENNSDSFSDTVDKLRSVLDGNFKINWNGIVLGYWVDMDGDKEKICQLDADGNTVTVYDIPQKIIKKYLTGNDALINFVPIDDPELSLNEELNEKILERRKEIKKENEFLTHIYPNAEYKSEENTNNKEPSEVISEEKVENKNIHTSNESIKNEINTLEKCRVLVGTDKYTNEIFWEFGNKQLANRHLLITGTSGQGKTYCIQSMLYELSKNKISSLVFDYTEGFRKDQLDPMFIEKMQNKIHQHFIYNEGVPINPFKIQDIIFEGNTVKEKKSDVAARIANVFKHVYNFGDQQFSAIFEAARKGLEEYGEEMNMSIFQEMLDKEKTNNKTAKSVLSKMSPFFHGIEFNTSSDFEWRKILYSDDPELTIFQLTNIDREMQVIITELMLWDAWYFTKKEGNKDKPFVTILDEAQNLSHKEKSPSASILTEGRKFGWSAWFATQSLKVLDDDEVTRLSQAATKLYFKPTNTELQRVAKIIEPSNWELQQSQLQNLKKGQCIFVGDRLGSNGKFGLGQPTITGITPFTERK